MDTLFSNVTVVTMDEELRVLFSAFVGVTDGKISYLSFVGDHGHESELADKYAQISERLAKIAEIRETIANTKTSLDCPGCGKECSKEDAFCSKCGHKLS